MAPFYSRNSCPLLFSSATFLLLSRVYKVLLNNSSRIRTGKCRDQSPVPYLLAIELQKTAYINYTHKTYTNLFHFLVNASCIRNCNYHTKQTILRSFTVFTNYLVLRQSVIPHLRQIGFEPISPRVSFLMFTVILLP